MRVHAGLTAIAAAARHGDKIALSYEGADTSFAELDRQANLAGSGLIARGVEPGSVVGVLMYNRPEVVHLWLGCERAGLFRLPLHSHFEMQTHIALLDHVRSRTIIFDSRMTAMVESQLEDLEGFLLICIGHDVPEWAVSWSDVTESGSPEPHNCEVDENTAAFIQPTTGTTGQPKPWIVTHRSWTAVVNQNLHHLDTFADGICAFGPHDVVMHVHPLQWASGFQLLYPGIIRGARTLLVDDSRFDPEAILDLIIEESVTCVLLPAPMLTPILDAAEARGTLEHSIERLVVFFATPELLLRTSDILGPVWCHGFGSTEQGAVTTRLRASDIIGHDTRLHSVGLPASPFFEVEIINGRGERAADGELGEIVVRSAMSTSSYWNLPERTANAFLDGDWFRPDDVGYKDADGFLYYVDRAGDSIHTSLGTVYPHAVESAVLRHHAVANCGVVGNGADGVVAAIVLKAGYIDSPDLRAEIGEFALPGLGAHEVPEILVVEELPTVLGGAKVQRKVLQEMLVDNR
ncbi:AMP-binding protein [Nocardia rhamnosiphila]